MVARLGDYLGMRDSMSFQFKERSPLHLLDPIHLKPPLLQHLSIAPTPPMPPTNSTLAFKETNIPKEGFLDRLRDQISSIIRAKIGGLRTKVESLSDRVGLQTKIHSPSKRVTQWSSYSTGLMSQLIYMIWPERPRLPKPSRTTQFGGYRTVPDKNRYNLAMEIGSKPRPSKTLLNQTKMVWFSPKSCISTRFRSGSGQPCSKAGGLFLLWLRAYQYGSNTVPYRTILIINRYGSRYQFSNTWKRQSPSRERLRWVTYIQSAIGGLDDKFQQERIHSLLSSMDHLISQMERAAPRAVAVPPMAAAIAAPLTSAPTTHLPQPSHTCPTLRTYSRSRVGVPPQIVGPSMRTRSRRTRTTTSRTSSTKTLELSSSEQS